MIPPFIENRRVPIDLYSDNRNVLHETVANMLASELPLGRMPLALVSTEAQGSFQHAVMKFLGSFRGTNDTELNSYIPFLIKTELDVCHMALL